jgi:hypothetical protein
MLIAGQNRRAGKARPPDQGVKIRLPRRDQVSRAADTEQRSLLFSQIFLVPVAISLRVPDVAMSITSIC